MTDQELSQENRANLVTARESARRAAEGYDDVDFIRVIGTLYAVLASSCPHNPEQYTRTEVDGGHEIEVTCPSCNVAWRERTAAES